MTKRNFTKFSLFQKVEIYLIFLMFIFISFYYLDDFIPTKKTIYKTNNSPYKIKIINIKEKFKKVNKNNIIKILYEKSEESNIILKNIVSKKRELTITFTSDFSKAFSLIHYLSHHFIINNINIIKVKNELDVSINFDIKYLYNHKRIYTKEKNIPNPFKTARKKTANKKTKYTLNAIIYDHVSINHKWYKKEDTVDKYKITNIYLNKVELTHSINKFKLILKVYNE